LNTAKLSNKNKNNLVVVFMKLLLSFAAFCCIAV